MPVPHSLTQIAEFPQLPTPAVFNADQCKAGCYTNAQMRQLLDDVVDWGFSCVESLRSIRVYSDEQVEQMLKRP